MYLGTDSYTKQNPAVCSRVEVPASVSPAVVHDIVQTAFNKHIRGVQYIPGSRDEARLADDVSASTNYPPELVRSVLYQVNQSMYQGIGSGIVPSTPPVRTSEGALVGNLSQTYGISPFTTARITTTAAPAPAPPPPSGAPASPAAVQPNAATPALDSFWDTDHGRTIRNAALGAVVALAVGAVWKKLF